MQTIKLKNPLGVSTPKEAAKRIIDIITTVSGTAAFFMFVYAGFIWTTSLGDSKKVAQAKDMFKNASIGMALIFSAYALINYVFSFFAQS